jgi:hypothetical protein
MVIVMDSTTLRRIRMCLHLRHHSYRRRRHYHHQHHDPPPLTPSLPSTSRATCRIPLYIPGGAVWMRTFT